MKYALPSGVVNTDSVYFYADTTLTFVPLVKQLNEQTLVIIDYSKLTPPPTVTNFQFAIDVTSNPALVVSYPQLNPQGNLLTFLLSGGIEGQQYNLSIGVNTRTDVLTINIPSFSGDCEQINPVPEIYSQLPLGEPTQGYVNTGVRYFWGVAPPTNPNVMDQWYVPNTNILYEWVTDGMTFFWQTVMGSNFVGEAPKTNTLFSRYNGFWVADPIQADAPVDGHIYVRTNGGWEEAPAGTLSSNVLPLMDGVADAGVSDEFARGDHVHPTDTNVYIDCGVY